MFPAWNRPAGLLLFFLAISLTGPLVAQTENAATRDYAVALGFEKKGHYPQAIERWTQFLKNHPQEERAALARYHLGLCQYQEKDFAKAAEAFQQVLSGHPKFAHRDAVEFNLALVLYQQASASAKPEDFRKAGQAFAEMEKHHPQSPQAVQAAWYQAECLYQAGDKPKAVETYQRAITTYKDSPLLPEIYLAAGTTLHELEQHDQAEKSFLDFLNRFGSHPKTPEAKLRLGLVKLSREKWEEAERFFREAASVKEFPLADFAELKRGEALFHRDRFAEAAQAFEQLPGKYPQSKYLADALLSAGKSRYREGKFPEAERSLNQLLQQHKESPQFPEASYWLGQTLRALKRSPDAVRILDAAIASPQAGEFKPQLEFARLEALADQPMKEKESLAQFIDYAARHPQHPLAFDALYRSARIALELGDYPTGRKQSAAFLGRPEADKHPLWGETVFIAAECELLNDQPNTAQAEKFYRELIGKRPEHPQTPVARVRIGHCLHANNQHDPALAWLNETLKQIKDKPLLAEAHFLIGRSHAGKKEVKPAIEAYRRSLQADPNWPRGDEVLIALAEELEAEGSLPPAINELNQLISRYPNSPLLPRCLSRLGHLKSLEKKWDEAANFYRQLVAKFPEHELAPRAQYRLGACYFQKPDQNAAVNELTVLLTKWPNSDVAPAGRYLRGASYFQLKQYPKAIEDLTAYLNAKPAEAEQKVEAQLTLALAHSAVMDFRQAAQTLEALLKESPTSAKADQAYYELGFAYQKLNEPQNALEAFQNLADKFPESPLAAEAWFRVGEHHEAGGNLAEAVKGYRAGLAKASDGAFKELLFYKIGHALYEQKAYAEAAGELKKLLADFPKTEYRDDALHLQAECEFAQEKFDQALPLYVQAAQSPEEEYHARACYRAGQCATRLKNWTDAEKHFQAVVDRFEKFPQRTEARYGLAFALQNQRKFDAARSQYQAVIKETETESAARSRFMLGECDFAEQKFDTAWEHYLEAALGYPYDEWKAQGHYQAARCFIQLKKPEKAREELQTVIEKHPQHTLAKDARKLLATLP